MLIRRQVLRDCNFGAKSVQLHKCKSVGSYVSGKRDEITDFICIIYITNEIVDFSSL